MILQRTTSPAYAGYRPANRLIMHANTCQGALSLLADTSALCRCCLATSEKDWHQVLRAAKAQCASSGESSTCPQPHTDLARRQGTSRELTVAALRADQAGLVLDPSQVHSRSTVCSRGSSIDHVHACYLCSVLGHISISTCIPMQANTGIKHWN